MRYNRGVRRAKDFKLSTDQLSSLIDRLREFKDKMRETLEEYLDRFLGACKKKQEMLMYI